MFQNECEKISTVDPTGTQNYYYIEVLFPINHNFGVKVVNEVS